MSDSSAPPESKKETLDQPSQSPAEETAQFIKWVTYRISNIEAGYGKDNLPWCDQWWKHPEAVDRLRALWIGYADAVTSTSNFALSSWWVDHFDRHAHILFSPELSPFRHCYKGNHAVTGSTLLSREAVTAPPPPDWLL